MPQSAQSWGLGPPPSMCARDYVLAFLVLGLKKVRKRRFFCKKLHTIIKCLGGCFRTPQGCSETPYDAPPCNVRPEVALTSLDVSLGAPGRTCMRTDGRVELCATSVPAMVEPRTFVKWVLKEQHSHQTFGQWRRQQSDGNLACHRPRSTM